MTIKAVIFDLGGVVLDSPLDALARYEARQGLPHNFLNRLIVEKGREGSWSKLERGKLGLEEFFNAFDSEAAQKGARISSVELMLEIAKTAQVRPVMLEAIQRLRARGLKVAALTNNWLSEGPYAERMDALREQFDVFIESSSVGLQKPDPRIYELTCQELGIQPEEAVFLDDIGRNLKPAREMGMATVRVSDPDTALAELEALLGIDLRGVG
jgi:putative hydrolase of the HAD superfamily